ncbi:MAG: hypothetical protein LCH95_09370 [Proteobacteria bacterium]|nr:hypothetical protein [Pseudomonadota bacterium]
MTRGPVLASVAILAVLAAAAALPGCAPQCGATEARLSSLHRGMTTREVASVMGCPGATLPTGDEDGPAYALLAWDGPHLLLSVRTVAAFQDDRLLYVYTEGRGGLDADR